MYFRDFLAVLLRRWLIIVLGAVLTAAGCGAAVFLVPTNYQATGQMLLLLPPQASGTTPINPYLNLDPGLTVAASLIAATAMSDDTQKDMVANGFTATYSVAITPGSGPLLEISVEDTDGEMAVKTRDQIMDRLDTDLKRIQTEVNAPSRQLISARRNNVSSTAVAIPGSKIRALAAIGALGVVVTLIVAVVTDRRRLRTAAKSKPTSGSQPDWSDNGDSTPDARRQASRAARTSD